MRVTLVEPVEFVLEIKKSRFLGRVEPIEDFAAGLAVVEQLRQQHPEARHVCFSMLSLGQVRQSDDGEPSGTAAAPMLNVLQHKNLDQVLATVVRYFGGIKLGAGGLVRAYSQTISQALQTAEFISLTPKATVSVTVGFEHESLLRHLAQQYSLEVNLNYTHTVEACLSGVQADLDTFVHNFSEQVRGQLVVST